MTTYAFSHATAIEEQLACLQYCLDPTTIGQLGPIHKGARCWEIGAGAGSIAAYLADQVGPTGHVLATDIDISQLNHLRKRTNVTVVEHDITTLTAPDPGPYDLIHARLVLLHLPQRHDILPRLANHLTPGGLLVIEEFDCTQPPTLTQSTSSTDQELVTRVIGAILATLESNGADLAWARHVPEAMRTAGLVDITTTTTHHTGPGGSPAARLHAINARQLAAHLTGHGITDTDLDRFHTLMHHPDTTVSLYPQVSTRGRRPTDQPPATPGRAT